mgnify:CR=1 FL=1
MPNAHRALSRLSLTGLLTSLVLLAATWVPAKAQAGAPQAFDARYHLSVDGWPDATIRHHLYREGDHWLSDMRARVAIAEGQETSRFADDGNRLRSLSYSSGYTLFGMGKRYSLARDELTRLPDRQTALVALAQQVQEGACQSDCRFSYLDHKGETETLVWRRLAAVPIEVDGNSVPAPTIELTEPGKEDRRMIMSFHPRLPGLLLGLSYDKRGERISELSLMALDTEDATDAN